PRLHHPSWQRLTYRRAPSKSPRRYLQVTNRRSLDMRDRFSLLPLSLAVLVAAVLPLRSADEKATGAKKNTPTLAHLRLAGDLEEGPIPLEPLFGGGESFKSRLDRIKKAQQDKNIQALYLEIDELSIGWAKVEELRAAIAACRKAGKKVIAYVESGSTK